jgi:hypothetical protein
MTKECFGPVCPIFAIMIQGVSVPFTCSSGLLNADNLIFVLCCEKLCDIFALGWFTLGAAEGKCG